MALELEEEEDTWATTGRLGPARLTPVLVLSDMSGRLEMVRLDVSACTLLSERVTDSKLSSAGDGGVMEDG